MIDDETLSALVPRHTPEADFPARDFEGSDYSEPVKRLALWADYLRWTLSQKEMDSRLDYALRTSTFVGVGVFHAPRSVPREYTGFPVVGGYQFGVALLRASWLEKEKYLYMDSVTVEFGRYEAPVLQFLAEAVDHGSPEGMVAAIASEDETMCGLTARHVVGRFRKGERVPVECSSCDSEARLRRKGPGLIDVALVEFPCGGPVRYLHHRVRSAVEGSSVCLHGRARVRSTVAASLSTPSQIKSAAMPMHFLMTEHGRGGDSGCLVASSEDGDDPDVGLIGMYLGETDCQLEDGLLATYGYALDLRQAADMLGVTICSGDFND